jgi:hypothetical protein
MVGVVEEKFSLKKLRMIEGDIEAKSFTNQEFINIDVERHIHLLEDTLAWYVIIHTKAKTKPLPNYEDIVYLWILNRLIEILLSGHKLISNGYYYAVDIVLRSAIEHDLLFTYIQKNPAIIEKLRSEKVSFRDMRKLTTDWEKAINREMYSRISDRIHPYSLEFSVPEIQKLISKMVISKKLFEPDYDKDSLIQATTLMYLCLSVSFKVANEYHNMIKRVIKEKHITNLPEDYVLLQKEIQSLPEKLRKHAGMNAWNNFKKIFDNLSKEERSNLADSLIKFMDDQKGLKSEQEKRAKLIEILKKYKK